MPYVIGTAGHIDHGKTSLVKALTGQDTDRLKEEKERGISIDLGFAHLDLPGGVRAGIVDVPGHERFIRNMLAGAHGIDLVLFTIAADDGVMPQTEEHFDILHLLGVEHAIFVLTKSDLVSDRRIADVRDDVSVLAAGTALERAPVIPFSSVSHEGIEGLRAEIARALSRIHKPPPPGYFRLPVDRVFVLQGHGVVATGTAVAGQVRVGDHVRVLPGDQVLRVRSLQVHNEPVERASWGQRVALNLSGPNKPSIERGHVLGDERLVSSSERFDAWLEARTSGPGSSTLKSHQRVRVHIGTAERLAKLILLGGEDRIASRQTAYCQLALTSPVFTLRGDRFVIRDETAQRTLGGGVVLHPWPRIHRRREAGLGDRMRTLHQGDLPAVLQSFVGDHEAFAVALEPMCEFANRTSDQVAAALSAAGGLRRVDLEGEHVYTTETKWRAAAEALLGTLRAFHAGHPLAPGQEMEALRGALPGRPSPSAFRALVAELEAEARLVREGSVLRLKEHTVALDPARRQVAERITALLRERALMPPDVQELEKSIGLSHAELAELMRVLEREGAVTRVSRDLYFAAETVAAVTRTVREALAGGDGTLTAAAFRDRFGTSRKYAIPLLEYLDRTGVTMRVGDARRLR